MKITFVYNVGRSTRLEGLKKNNHPTEFFYGAIELIKQGHDVSILEIDPKNGSSLMATIINLFAQKQLLPDKVTGNLLLSTSKHIKQLQKADCIVASTSGLAFSVSMLPSLKDVPLVGIHCGLLNSSPNVVKQFIRSFFLKRMDTILFGEGESRGINSWSSRLVDKIHVCDFGVDTNFWYPDQTQQNRSKPYVLSVGNDGRRDFETLVKAAAKIHCEVKILTQRPLPKNLPSNVVVLRGGWHNNGLTDIELREQYQGASCVVLPLKESRQPSGQSVALQAMACGCPVIMSRTEGVWSLDKLKDGENILFFGSGDSQELADKIDSLLHHPEDRIAIGSNGLQLVRENWTIDNFAIGVERACKIAVNRRSSR